VDDMHSLLGWVRQRPGLKHKAPLPATQGLWGWPAVPGLAAVLQAQQVR